MFGAGKKASAAVETRETPKGPTMSPLHWAAWHGQEAGIDMVLSLDKLLLHSRDDQGNTPLHIACKGGHGAIVAKLFDACGDVNCTNKHRDTLLHCAGIIQTVFRECRKPTRSCMNTGLRLNKQGRGLGFRDRI